MTVPRRDPDKPLIFDNAEPTSAITVLMRGAARVFGVTPETPFRQSFAKATTDPSEHIIDVETVGLVGDGAVRDIIGRFAVKPDIEANPEFDPPAGTCETDESILAIMVTAALEGELIPPDVEAGIQYHPPLQSPHAHPYPHGQL
jgi:hypothetical protein